MLDRRHFLIGAGGLLTTAFVRKASAFSRRFGEPLILTTARKPEETLHVYLQDWDDHGDSDYERQMARVTRAEPTFRAAAADLAGTSSQPRSSPRNHRGH